MAQVPASTVRTPVSLLTNYATQGYGPTVMTLNASTPYVLLDAFKVTRADLTFQLSWDGATYRDVPVQDLHTGQTVKRIESPGRYLLDTWGATNLRVQQFVRGAGVSTVTAYPLRDRPVVSGVSLKRWTPKAPVLPADTTFIRNLNAYGINAAAHLPIATLYGFSSATMRKSVDGGATWASFGAVFERPLRRVVKLADGALLVVEGTVDQATGYSKVYRVDEATDTRTLVLTCESLGASPSESLQQCDIQGSQILLLEYGNNAAAENPRRGYRSTDYGLTWEKIFEGPLASTMPDGTWHTHGIVYDPYGGLYWIVNGDLSSSSNVQVSRDGKNWTKVYSDGFCPTQWTAIIPLPNCVLFTSDNPNWSVWRWDRPDADGIEAALAESEAAKLHIVPAFTISRNVGGAEPIGTQPAVVYGANACAIFGFAYFPNGVWQRNAIYATADGHSFHVLWTSPDLQAQAAGGGIRSISGPSQDGYVVANYEHKPAGQTYAGNLVKIKIPDWR